MMRLPLDVLDCVVQQAYEQRKDVFGQDRLAVLKALSTTCRALCRSSQKLLFRRARVSNFQPGHFGGDTHDAHKLHLFLRSSPHLGTYVRCLRYEMDSRDRDVDAASDIPRVFNLLPNIEEFTVSCRWSGLEWTKLPPELCTALKDLIRRPKLRYFRLDAYDALPLSVLKNRSRPLHLELSVNEFILGEENLVVDLPCVEIFTFVLLSEECIKSLPILLCRCTAIKTLQLEASDLGHLRGFGTVASTNINRSLTKLSLVLNSVCSPAGSELMEKLCEEFIAISNASNNNISEFDLTFGCGKKYNKTVFETFRVLDRTLTPERFPKWRRLVLNITMRTSLNPSWDNIRDNLLQKMAQVSSLECVDVIVNLTNTMTSRMTLNWAA